MNIHPDNVEILYTKNFKYHDIDVKYTVCALYLSLTTYRPEAVFYFRGERQILRICDCISSDDAEERIIEAAKLWIRQAKQGLIDERNPLFFEYKSLMDNE